MTVTVQPIDAVDARVLDTVEGLIRRQFGAAIDVRPALPAPSGSWDPRRGQYSSVAFMQALAATVAGRVLGVTACDLFIPMLTFVFGQAQLSGNVALVSYARLRQEFYELPADPALLQVRVRKEVLHELGHTNGLIHCTERTCVMSLSTSILQVDVKRDHYCDACRRLLDDQLASLKEHRT